ETKLSGIGLVAGLGLAALFFVGCGGRLGIPGRNERGLGPAVELAIRIGTIAIVVVAATYAFIHFPEWARGLKFQLTRHSHSDGVAYLNGEISRDGWYHYFLIALPLKLSLGLLIAAVAGALSLIGLVRQASGARWLFLVLPPIVFFALASYSRVNVGVRAVYPFVPFLYLLAGGLAAGACCALARSAILAVCLGICVGSAQRASPYELSFFNELVRGPENGAKHLADSNLDWGQGLPALKRWMDAHGVEMVYLGYFGTDRPESHGIRYQSLPGYGGLVPRGETIPANAPRHVLAVSVNNLLGLQLNDPETYSWLRDREPAAVVAGCIHVYDLTGDPAAIARVRALPSR
ncbi:MAG TPA: hypothetical protein VLM40_19385, partial [Gemmata sp.]|nr:hypothetical protein [Gemmata sp.]